MDFWDHLTLERIEKKAFEMVQTTLCPDIGSKNRSRSQSSDQLPQIRQKVPDSTGGLIEATQNLNEASPPQSQWTAFDEAFSSRHKELQMLVYQNRQKVLE